MSRLRLVQPLSRILWPIPTQFKALSRADDVGEAMSELIPRRVNTHRFGGVLQALPQAAEAALDFGPETQAASAIIINPSA
jgi:hypothetical protein